MSTRPNYSAVMDGWDAEAYRRQLEERRRELLNRVHTEATAPLPAPQPIPRGQSDLSRRLGEVAANPGAAATATSQEVTARRAVDLARRFGSVAVSLADPRLASALHPDLDQVERTANAVDALPRIAPQPTGNRTLDAWRQDQHEALVRDRGLTVEARYRYSGLNSAQIVARLNAEEDARAEGHGEFWRIMHTDLARLVFGDNYRTDGVVLDTRFAEQVRHADGTAFDIVRDRLGRGLANLMYGALTTGENSREMFRALQGQQFVDDGSRSDPNSFVNSAYRMRDIVEGPARAGSVTQDEFFDNPFSAQGADFVGQQMGEAAPSLAVAMTGPVGWLFLGASTTGSVAQTRARNEGRDFADLGDAVKASPFGVASAALDRIGARAIGSAGGAVMSRLSSRAASTAVGAAGSSVFRTAAVGTVKSGLVEMGTEGAQGGIEYAGGVLGTGAEWNTREMLRQQVVGMIVGFGLGASTHAGIETADAGYRGVVRRAARVTQLADSEAGAASVNTILDSAAQHTVRTSNPEIFREYLATLTEGTPAERVYVPAEAIDRILQQDGLDKSVAGYLDTIREQIDDARSLGGDVVMPLADFATVFAGTKAWTDIQADVKMSPSHLSPREMANERPAILAEIESAYRASQGQAQTTLLNIGMKVDAEGIVLTRDEIVAAVEAAGGKITSEAQHVSDSEPTMVLALDAPLTPEQANQVSVALRQDAIAQTTGNEGALIGPKAADWGTFDPKFFLMPDGSRMSETGPLNQSEPEEITQIYEEVKSQITDIGVKPADAGKYAALFAANRASQASAMGVSALDYHRSNPVEFRRDGADAQTAGPAIDAEGFQHLEVRAGDLVKYAVHDGGMGENTGVEVDPERQAVNEALYKSISEEGVREFVKLNIDPVRGTAMLENGNHRVSMANHIDPDMLVPVRVSRISGRKPQPNGKEYAGEFEGSPQFNQAPTGAITPSISTAAQIEAKAQELADAVPGFDAMLPYLTTEEKDGLKAKSVEKLVKLFDEWPSAEEMASIAYSGRAKRGWYERSALALLDVFGPMDAPRFAALLAALSPQTSVEANAVNALKMWTNWDIAGRPTDPREILNLLGKSVQGGNGIGSVLNAWINNSVTALTTESPHDIVLSGPKVNSFMLNLMGVMDEVTNDAWMANFALIDQSVFAGRKGADGKSGKGLGYKAASAVVRKAADILTERTGELWTPAEVQETVWSWVKTLTEKRDGAGPFTAEKILEAGGLTHADIAKTPDFAQLFIRGVYRRVLEVGGYSAQVFALERSGSAGGSDVQEGSAANPEGAGVPADAFTAHLRSAAGRIEKRFLARYAAKQDDRQLTLFQDARPANGGLLGLPTVVKVDGMPVEFGPFQPARDAAERVARRLGLRHNLPKTFAPVDVDRAERIAAAFEAMDHDPSNPDVKAAYDALVQETLVQWDEIKKSGLQVEFIVGDDPYGNPRKAILDVVENNHLWVFPTDDGFGSSTFDPADNPLLAEVPGEFISGRPVRVNDIFRVVHDYFGHIMEGVGFRARGEENAWRVHSAMFSPLARKALTTETRGQNSWVNFGPKGAENRTADGASTVYADQKVGLLPDWVVNEGVDDVAPAAREHAARLRKTPGMQDVARRVRANSDGVLYVTEDGAILSADKPWNVNEADRKARSEQMFSTPEHPVELVHTDDPRLITAEPLAHSYPPVNPDNTITLTHYSSASGLSQLDPEFWGTSGRFLPPSERSSIGTAPGRTYFGIAPGEPGGYSVEFGGGTHVYTTRVPASRLYPVGLDPEGVVKANPRRWESAVAALPGYDGYWMNHGQLGLVAAVFTPTQVEQGEWQTYYQEGESVFYSAVENAVRAGQNKATAAQWKATLANTPGVKAEEMEWTGLGDMLDADPTAVLTKDDLLRVVENGRIEIFETVKGGTHTASVSWSAEDEQYGVWADDDWVSWHDDQDEAVEAAEAWDTNSAAKWSAYTVDGHSADGYRELLLRIPSGFRGNPARSPDTHWEEQGVVAHIRFSEKTDIDNKRVMFIDEIQSDWHQKGRELGYEKPVDPAAVTEAEARLENAREAETKALKEEGNFALSAFGIDEINAAVAKLERGETRLQIVAATADNALTDKIMGDLHYAKQSANRNVRKDSPEEVYAENFEASYRYSRAVKAGYPGSAIDADTAFAFSQYVDRFGLASGHALKDRVDAEFEASDYGKHIALVEARRILSNDRALRGRELDVARGAITNGGVPRAPFRNTWHVLAMRRAIRWAAEQGFDRIAWIRGNEQNGGQTVVTVGEVALIPRNDQWTVVTSRTGAATGIADKVAALRKSDAFKGEKGDKEYVYTSDEIRAVFNTYDDRLGDRMVERGAGTYDAEHVGVADDGHFFYDRMLVNDTNALIKKYKAKVAPAKIRFADRGRPDTISDRDLRVVDERAVVMDAQARGEERQRQIREELGRIPTSEDYRADEALVRINDEFQAAKLDLQLAIRATQAEENQRWADGLTSNPAFDITPEMREAALKGFPMFQGDNRPAGARGQVAFSDSKAVITVFENADLSTLLHETGHVFFEEMRRNIASGKAPAQMQADWATLVSWLSDNGQPVVDNAITRDGHELIARGFERYLMEGKPPSEKLSGVFASFRNWLITVYRTVTALRSPITPEVRQVFDRLLATEDEIDTATQAHAKALLTEKPAGMTVAEFEAYRNTILDARNEAYNRLLEKTMRSIKAMRLDEYRAQRNEAREAIAAEVNAEPRFRALDALRADMRLDRDWVAQRYGEDALNMLPKGPILVKRGGDDADFIAESTGFGSGAEMMEALFDLAAETEALRVNGDKRSVRDKIIADRVAAEMESLGATDPLKDAAIEAEAIAAINGERQGEVLTTELKTLGKTMGRRATPYRVAREWAARKIAAGRVFDTVSRSAILGYQRAADRAGKLAEEAYVTGNIPEAFRQKQAQLINHALVAEARKAATEIERISKRMQRLSRRAQQKSIDASYFERVQQLLALFEFRPVSQKMLDEREGFLTWAAKQAEAGFEVIVPERLIVNGGHYSRVAVSVLMDLDNAVASLMSLGRLKQRLADAKSEREFKAAVEDMVTRIKSLPERKLPNEINDKDRATASLVAPLLKVETLAEELDGGTTGPFNDLLVNRATQVENRRAQLRDDVYAPIARLYAEMPDEQRKRLEEKVTLPELPHRGSELDPRNGQPTVMTRMELLAVALNTGNSSNFDKLARGEQWKPAAIARVLDREMTQQDWQFVQAVWDALDTLWPDIAATEREMSGVVPERVEPRSVVTRFGTFRGGYYPVVYDPNRSVFAENNSANEANDLFGMKSGIGTPKGHTIARTDAAGPLRLSVEEVLLNHVEKVITRVAYAVYTRDVLRVIDNSRVARAIDVRLGREYRKQVRPWLQRAINSASVDRRGLGWIERLLRQARVNTTLVAMGFRWSTGVAQIAGLTASAGRVGAAPLARGIRQLLTQRGEAVEFVMSRSPEMARRHEEMNREVADMFKQLRGKNTLINRSRAMAFWHIAMVDRYVVAVPTWLAGFQNAIDAGESEASAINLADKAVRTSQGSGREKDLANWQSPTNETMRWLSLFYTYFNVHFQSQWQTVRAVKRKDFGKALMLSFWFSMAAPLADALLSGDIPDFGADDDEEKWYTWFARNIFFHMFSGVPVVRDMAAYGERSAMGQFASVAQTPIGRIEDATVKAAKTAKDAYEGEPGERWVKVAIETPGYFLGLPTGQAAATGQFLWDVSTGNSEPDGLADWYTGLTKGRLPEETD